MLEAETEGEEVEGEEKDRKRRRKTRAILPHLMGWGKKEVSMFNECKYMYPEVFVLGVSEKDRARLS